MTLPAFAARGPAWATLERLGATGEETWHRAATWFEREIPSGPHRAERIHWLCVPTAVWLLHHLRASARRPLVAGLSAPQGAGKSTLSAALVRLLDEEFGVHPVSLSIDDFYLPRSEQLALASSFPGNRFLEHRGYPGTHDLALGASVLEALVAGRPVTLPRYDKSAHGGRGDRSAEAVVENGPVDLVLLEGWMLGFSPVTTPLDPALTVVNEKLSDYSRWTRHLDVLLHLRMHDPSSVVTWRREAEAAMRASGRPGLGDAEVEDYVRRFLPAYETWTPTVGQGFHETRRLTMTLDANRTPLPTTAE